MECVNLEAYIEEYINNEINYIERYDYEGCKNDIVNLRGLQKADIQRIADKVKVDLENELKRVLTGLVQYRLYHYIESKNKEEN